jgi:hypothetical protein
MAQTEDLRKQNVEEAKQIFEEMAAIIQSAPVSWVWQKGRKERTKFVIALMSFLRLARGEYVFFNPMYLSDAIEIWKDLAETDPRDLEIRKWIQIYQERLKEKKDISGIGERVVDLSSSPYGLPFCMSVAMEYEPMPDWAEIMRDFRKLLNVLAPVKVGIFHLPSSPSTRRIWIQDDGSGRIEWDTKVLDPDKPGSLIEDMRGELQLNELEHPHTVYLTILVRVNDLSNDVILRGYLFWRETNGEVHSEMLEPRTFNNIG